MTSQLSDASLWEDDPLRLLLSLLGTAFPGGIFISELFDAVNAVAIYSQNIEGPNKLWQLLLQRDDILLPNGEKLCQSHLKELSYDDLLSNGLATVVIRLSAVISFESNLRDENMQSATGSVQRSGATAPASLEESHISSNAATGNSDVLVVDPQTPLRPSTTHPYPPHSNGKSSLPSGPHAPSASNPGGPDIGSTGSAPTPTHVAKKRGRKPKNQLASPAAPSSTSTRYTPRSGNERPVRDAVFTPQNHLDYQEGISGVYVKLPGTENPNVKRRGKALTSVAVFKSPALKDPEHLSRNRGSWAPYVAELLQKDVEDVKKTTKRPKRNPNPKHYNRKPKRLPLTHPQPSVLQNPKTGAWDLPSISHLVPDSKVMESATDITISLQTLVSESSTPTTRPPSEHKVATPSCLSLPPITDPYDPAMYTPQPPRVALPPGSYTQWGAPQASIPSASPGNDHQQSRSNRSTKPSSNPVQTPAASASPPPTSSLGWSDRYINRPPLMSGTERSDSHNGSTMANEHPPSNPHIQMGDERSQDRIAMTPTLQSTGLSYISPYSSLGNQTMGQKPSYSSPYAAQTPSNAGTGGYQVAVPPGFSPNPSYPASSGPDAQPNGAPVAALQDPVPKSQYFSTPSHQILEGSSVHNPYPAGNGVSHARVPNVGANDHPLGVERTTGPQIHSTHNSMHTPHQDGNRELMEAVKFTSGDSGTSSDTLQDGEAAKTVGSSSFGHSSQFPSSSYHLYPKPTQPAPVHVPYDQPIGLRPSPYRQLQPQPQLTSSSVFDHAHQTQILQPGETIHSSVTPLEVTKDVESAQMVHPNELVEADGTPKLDPMPPPAQDNGTEERTAKTAKIRKRNKPSTSLGKDIPQEMPLPKVRKTRQQKTPSQPGSNEIAPRKSSRLSATEEELENSLTLAEERPLPADLTRLACVFENKYVGNLILSKDFSTLEFLWDGQNPPEQPMLSLPVIEVTEEPITSARGSKPMQLRIKAVYQNDEGFVTHSFVYGPSPARAEAASHMRSKIIIAMAAEKLRAGANYVRPSEVREGIVKPFLCEKCGNRFKNINGLQYHQTKSKTACNPDFDITQLAAKIKRGPKPRAKKVVEDSEPEFDEDDEVSDLESSKPKKSRRVRKSKNFTPAKTSTPDIVQDDDDEGTNTTEGSNSSDESVLEWARKTAGITEDPTPSKPARIYKAFNRETQISKDILKAFHESGESEDQALEIPAPPSLFATGLPSLNELANQISSSEALTEKVCKQLILAVVNANQGILPGEKSIWVACVALWLKKHPTTNVIPRSTLCNKCTDDLLGEGKLQTEPFDYMGLRCRKLVGTFIFTPGVDLASQGCQMLKSLVEECTPRIYVPSHLAPPPGVLDGLQALAGRLIPNPDPPRKKVGEEEDEDLAEFDMSSLESEEKIYYEESTGDEFQVDEADEEDDFMDVEFDVEASDLQGPDKSRKGARRRKSSSTPGKRYRSATTNARISKSIKAWWGDIRAGKIPYPDNSKRRKKLDQASTYHTSQMWDAQPSFMPNHETGAWDMPVATLHEAQEKSQKYCSRIPFISEPITYLQAMDGSWSVRALGHGVKPVYSRPARRADGNPNLAAYLRKLEQGHRPIVYPTKRMMQPNVPSKKLLEKNGLAPVKTPVRRKPRKRKANELSLDDVDSLGFDSDAPRQKRKYVRRNKTSARSHMEIDEEEIRPREWLKLTPDAPLNPGLETIPPAYGLGEDTFKGDPSVMKFNFTVRYFDVKLMPQKYIGEPDDGPEEYSWTFHEPHQLAGDSYRLQWNDDHAFDMRTLPYDDLRYDSEKETRPANEFDSPADQVPASSRKRHKATKSGQYIPVAERALIKERSEKTRQQIALTTDFLEMGKDPAEMATKFDVEVTEPNEATRKRKRHASTTMSQADENKFIIAVIVQRVLTGGKEMYIDWVLISTLFHEHSMSFLRHYWRAICEGKQDVMDKITQDFRSAYPTAYQKRLVPKFNWDRLLDNDWNGLIRWVQANVVTPFGNSNDVVLPLTREKVEKQYDMMELDVVDDSSEIYYSLTAAKFKKVEAAATIPRAVPITKPYALPVDEEQEETERCARSWARAVCLTPNNDWDAAPPSVRNKLKQFGNAVATRAFESLITGKVLVHRNKGRPLPGRSYEGTDAFYATLRKHMKEPQFIEALTYKRWMDAEFRCGTPCLMVDYMANDGSIMVLTSLQAKGRIRIECQNVPRKKFGLTEEGYETKSIPREKLTFEMTVSPTPTYVFDDENEVLTSIFDSVPPRDDNGKIPVWYGISDVLIQDIWKRVIVAVSQILALRAGINLDGLEQVFKPTMERWELKLLIDWGLEVGLFERIDPTIEGWMVSEWWWAVAGRLCTMCNDDEEGVL